MDPVECGPVTTGFAYKEAQCTCVAGVTQQEWVCAVSSVVVCLQCCVHAQRWTAPSQVLVGRARGQSVVQDSLLYLDAAYQG